MLARGRWFQRRQKWAVSVPMNCNGPVLLIQEAVEEADLCEEGDEAGTLTPGCLEVNGGVPLELRIYFDPLKPGISCLLIR